MRANEIAVLSFCNGFELFYVNSGPVDNIVWPLFEIVELPQFVDGFIALNWSS